MKTLITALIVLLIGPATTNQWNARAESSPHYDHVTLSAQASTEVENDRMIVRFAAEAEQSTPAEVANEINRVMAKARQALSAYPDLKAATGNYAIHPVYVTAKFDSSRRIGHWRGSQELRLEGTRLQDMAKLTETLQSILVIKGMEFAVSRELRQQTLDRLMNTAIKRFQHRATLAANALGRDGFRLVDLSVGGSGHAPGPIQHRAMDMATLRAAAPVSTQPGSSEITVMVTGTVELQ
ncbi:MAG: SIMPL domain-containing protein [Gammaproteobacteria bacterium]